MAQYSQTFEIEPVAKGRPRFGSGFTFTPIKTRKFEADIRRLSRFKAPLSGPISLRVIFSLKKPKTSKNAFPIVRPDVDNLVKAVSDSLNGLWWNDDAQIIQLYVSKYYANKGSIQVFAAEVLNVSANYSNDPIPF